MKNFVRKSARDFHDIQSIDSYKRAIEEGFSEKEALDFTNLRSRDNGRVPFAWTNEKYGGFSKVKPWLAMAYENPKVNAADQEKDKNSVLNFYKKMIDFRKNSKYSDILTYGEFEPITSENKNIIAYERKLGDEKINLYFNFSKESIKEEIHKGDIIFASEDIKIEDRYLLLDDFGFALIK